MMIKNKSLKKLKTQVESKSKSKFDLIAVPRLLIHFTGKIQKALFLAQLIYWSDDVKRSDGFFAKTQEDWSETTNLSGDQVRAYKKEFAAKNLLETKKMKDYGITKCHYKLNFENLTNAVIDWKEKNSE